MDTTASPEPVGNDTLPCRITDAADAVESAKAVRDIAALRATEEHLRAAVQTARDSGVSWQSIGDSLGVARGAAYQRFRPRRETAYGADRMGPPL